MSADVKRISSDVMRLRVEVGNVGGCEGKYVGVIRRSTRAFGNSDV